MVFGIIKGYAHANVNLKNSIKGILYDFEKKMKNFIFQFFDENLLSAWFKDERPQGLSRQSALKGYHTILWQKYKNRIFRFFFLVKMVLVLFKGTSTQKLMWKIPLKGYCMILIPFYDKNIQIGFSGFFPYENGFWYYLRVRARKS